MPNLLIAYDLADPAATKPALVAEIMALGQAWARPLDSVWYVRTDRPTSEVSDRLAPLIGADDGLVVQPAPTDACLANTSLRWFRPRQGQERDGEGARAGNVVRLRRGAQAATSVAPTEMVDIGGAALRAAS